MGLTFVVAIGYSEGGLKALLTMFDHIPHDQATYVILRHVPINQRNLLTEILQKHSKLEIFEVENGMEVIKNKVYIPPSDSYVTIKRNKLYLHLRLNETKNYNYNIDKFLLSLAGDKKDRSIAVILSGGGKDGIDGIIEIHKAGGMIIAQQPETCEVADMPINAINTGLVHSILAPAEIQEVITQHVTPILKNYNEIRRLNKDKKC